MAAKEATVYIVDVGKTMGEKSHGRTQTNLDWALEYVWDRITATISTGRKTAMLGVIGLRTNDTVNPLQDEADYRHIKVLKEIDQALMPDVRRLRNELVVSNNSAGDATSALIIAIQMISEKCKKLQYLRKIVLVTDARANMDVDDLSMITDKIKEDKIELTILGVDFDDPEYGFKEEDKDVSKAENEEILKTLCQDCDGNCGTLAQAVDEIQIPRLKSTRPVASYKGYLTLGNPGEYETAITIDVERYPKTMTAPAPTASSFVLRSGVPDASQHTATQENGDGGQEDGDGLSNIKRAYTYQVVDEEAAGGKRDIPYDDLSRGYTYGRTAVHISESDRNVTDFPTSPGLDLLGFVDKHQYHRYLDMGRAHMIVNQKTNDKASMALSSLIRALYELDSYAVARLVPKENNKPQMVLLAPNIEPDFECLYEVGLPFAEDVRNFKFPPLDRVITVSGKSLKVHRNLPNDDLMSSMSDYVDSMDLSTFARDDEGEPTEYAPPDETYSPLVHRLHQVIKHRAIFPESQPPKPYEILVRFSQPPGDLVEKAEPALHKVIKTAEVKKVPPKARGKRWSRKDAPKPLSDLDVAALLAQDPQRKGKQIDPKNAIPEFKQILENAEKIEEIHDACKQLKFIIFDWINHSVGDSKYQQALEAIGVMRGEMLELEEAATFNEFMKELKKKILGGELGGDRKEMWYRVRTSRLRPIVKGECQGAEMTEEEGKQFMIPQ
ncbi:ATP-dependent DNA helicase II subunit 2 [Lecanosticta acicola]|uniref:ATP-dependent DNA helicase II subunit 2 n=1 Tax=Lecanosticta acicola TaxID=111012 RepID=A0AAI9E9U0_9PEZI|nr:ATP-dependent DNA helicase II subunit 2 [Lecanosticta acicola]